MVPLVADVTQAGSVGAAVAAILEAFGRVDVLVNNAGHISALATVADADAVDWWVSFETNVKGLFHVVRAFLKHARPGSFLLNVTTGLAHARAGAGHISLRREQDGRRQVGRLRRRREPGSACRQHAAQCYQNGHE